MESNRMRPLKMAVALLLMVCFTSACAKAREYPPAPRYENPTGAQFPILAYPSFPEIGMLTDRNFQWFKEAGFNVAVACHYNDETSRRLLEQCEKFGIKGILDARKQTTSEAISAYIKKFESYPALVGFLLMDEPNADNFAKLSPIAGKVVNLTDSRDLAYVNLFPNYASDKQLAANGYEDYVARFVEEVNPQMVSYDNYGIHEKDGEVVLRPEYFRNLEVVSKVTRESGRPMWTYILGTQHADYPYPTEGQLSFQAFMGLAYGSQCIQYFGYCIMPGGNFNYRNAALSPQSKRNSVWKRMKAVNQEVQALSPVLLGMRVKGVWHTGSSIPKGTKRLGDGDLPQNVSSLVSEGIGVAVSRFVNRGSEYLMIVNRDFSNKQKVNVKRNASVLTIDKKGRLVKESKTSYNLKPGGWLLFKVK